MSSCRSVVKLRGDLVIAYDREASSRVLGKRVKACQGFKVPELTWLVWGGLSDLRLLPASVLVVHWCCIRP